MNDTNEFLNYHVGHLGITRLDPLYRNINQAVGCLGITSLGPLHRHKFALTIDTLDRFDHNFDTQN